MVSESSHGLPCIRPHSLFLSILILTFDTRSWASLLCRRSPHPILDDCYEAVSRGALSSHISRQAAPSGGPSPLWVLPPAPGCLFQHSSPCAGLLSAGSSLVPPLHWPTSLTLGVNCSQGNWKRNAYHSVYKLFSVRRKEGRKEGKICF